MDKTAQKVLKAMKKAGRPVPPGDLAGARNRDQRLIFRSLFPWSCFSAKASNSCLEVSFMIWANMVLWWPKSDILLVLQDF